MLLSPKAPPERAVTGDPQILKPHASTPRLINNVALLSRRGLIVALEQELVIAGNNDLHGMGQLYISFTAAIPI